ncbi:RNA-binding protein 40 [Merluccius polli]|uniref:RNA-binding region-containing protein 3 n=1 Tax=Merluccius polli TaxID=89951 RepID=A0AA47M734_MERPO|nr:RNA-binding protein 40 [Merluccius polli]
MDQDDVSVQANHSKTLLVRHLPSELSREEKEDLLQHFGACSVRVGPAKGPLKHAAYATFGSEKSAAKALNRLHQLQILSHTLVVEFAKGQDHITVLKDPPVSGSATGDDEEQKKQKKQPSIPLIEIGVAPSLGLKFQTNPTLKYLYPPPSNAILANIMHAILSAPKFYIQVVHLMNKMNLPCPFGPVTPRPPVYDLAPAPMPPPFPPDHPPLPQEDMELSSEPESEYDSGDDDENKERVARLMGLVNQACKRPLRTRGTSKRKKPRIKDLLSVPPKSDSQSAPGPALNPSDVFEQPQPAGPKKIEFHISVPDVAAILEGGGPEAELAQDGAEGLERQTRVVEEEWAEGFGKLYPSGPAFQEQEQESQDEEDLPSDLITRRELEKGRLSRDEIKRMSVFKNYEPGEPTCRLYVKNIAKQVEEKDLKYIYGRYIDLSSESERNMFDIVLMKEGRMKGQAFVGLPSERCAEKALRDTNGYVLYDKPLVVVSFSSSPEE